MADQTDSFWLNNILDEIEKIHPEGEILISSGISPSATYHMGHFREVLSSDLIKWGLEIRGRKVRHIHVVDNFDPLRKRYDFLPAEYEQYVGWPICLVPAPDGQHASYADQFFDEFYQSIERLNVEVEVIKSYEDLYKPGKMAPYIEQAVAGVDKIKTIFGEVANRQLPDDWMPLQILDDKKSYKDWRYSAINTDSKEISYAATDGQTGQVRYDNGRVKLNWRLDWPARWALLGVMVEPHGFQEHGAAGGSYETGVRFAKEVFGAEPPIPGFQYGHTHLKGDSKKMSSSLGNLITPAEAFKLMPPEMVRYLHARYPGKKRIDFDPGLGFMRLMDEFAEVDRAVRAGEEHAFAPAYQYAIYRQTTPGMADIPFNHLVSVYQAALGDVQEAKAILIRTEHGDHLQEQKHALDREFTYVAHWLEHYAPEEVKFTLQTELPAVELTNNQRQFLGDLADKIDAQTDAADGQWFHNLVHEQREAHQLEPAPAFAAIYRVLLGKDHGPKAGWFLSILDKAWLAKRFRQASAQS